MAAQISTKPLLVLAGAGLLAFPLGCAHRAAYTTPYAADEDQVEVSAPRLPETRVDEPRARRADTLRSLAAELDERARRLARVASVAYGPRGHAEHELKEQTRRFAEEAGELRERLEREDRGGRDVRDQVEKLNKIARRVDARLREARAVDETYEEWNGAASVLDELNRVAFGRRYRPARDERRREPEPSVVIPRDGFEDDDGR